MSPDRRIISFDLLRGLAALGVAIPHLLLLSFHDVTLEGLSIIAVEIFFALSGFVLAPQIIYLHKYASNYNLWVFFLRRWIRTVFPYAIALTLIALLTSHIFSLAFVQKMFFLDTFSKVPKTDFFAISWSLAVEEWYYISAALLVFLFRNVPVVKLFTMMVCGLFLVKLFGFFMDPDWAISVRRATIYRLDAIAFGFLMYMSKERLTHSSFKTGLFVLGAIAIVLLALYGFKEKLFGLNQIYMFGVIYALSIFSLSVVYFFYLQNKNFTAPWLIKVSDFLGCISYPVYLFHLPIGYAFLKLKLSIWVSFPLALITVILFSWLFHDLIETLFIDKRPKYKEKLSSISHQTEKMFVLTPWRLLKAWGLVASFSCVALLGGELLSRYYLKNKYPQLKHDLIYSKRNMNKLGTKHILGAIDPQMGYAHPRRIAYKTKSYGVSQQHGYGIHRPKQGEFLKIFVLGGSTSDPFLAIKKKIKPWTGHLYVECRKHQNCGIWNGGVGGYGSPQELIKLVRDIVPEKPDMVLSLHGPNELNRNGKAPYMTGNHLERVKAEAKKGKIWFDGWLPNLFTLLGKVRNNDDIPSQDREIYYGHRYTLSPFARWKSNVIMMHAIAKSHNIKYRTILQPLVGYGGYKADKKLLAASKRGKKYYALVDRFYRQATAFCKTVDYCIDISHVFDGRKEALYGDIRHPNDAGNKIMAKAIASELRKRGDFQ